MYLHHCFIDCIGYFWWGLPVFRGRFLCWWFGGKIRLIYGIILLGGLRKDSCCLFLGRWCIIGGRARNCGVLLLILCCGRYPICNIWSVDVMLFGLWIINSIIIDDSAILDLVIWILCCLRSTMYQVASIFNLYLSTWTITPKDSLS